MAHVYWRWLALWTFAALQLHCIEARAYCLTSVVSGACVEANEPRLFWSRNCVSYQFHEQAFAHLPAFSEQEVRDITNTSFTTWSDVDCGQASFFVEQLPGTTSTTPIEFVKDVPNEFVLSALTPEQWASYPVLNNDTFEAFAITLLWHNSTSGEIYDVDMALNLSLGDFGRCDRPCSDGTIDLQNTLTHEAGHVYGLGHNVTQRDATMFTDATPGANFMRTLTSDDEAGMCALDLPSFECSSGDTCTCPTPPPLRSPSRRAGGCSVLSHGHPGGPGALTIFAPLTLALLFRRRPRAPKSPPTSL